MVLTNHCRFHHCRFHLHQNTLTQPTASQSASKIVLPSLERGVLADDFVWTDHLPIHLRLYILQFDCTLISQPQYYEKGHLTSTNTSTSLHECKIGPEGATLYDNYSTRRRERTLPLDFFLSLLNLSYCDFSPPVSAFDCVALLAFHHNAALSLDSSYDLYMNQVPYIPLDSSLISSYSWCMSHTYE